MYGRGTVPNLPRGNESTLLSPLPSANSTMRFKRPLVPSSRESHGEGTQKATASLQARAMCTIISLGP